jgi:hypothetical protein
MTAYGARCPVSLTNTENLHIGRIDSSGAVSALELLGRKSKNRTQHLGPVVDAVYSESPHATNMPAGEAIAVIDAVAGRVNYLQVRGAETGSRPQIRFRGEGYQVNLDVISSLAQQQPDIRIEGAGIELTGVVHSNTKLFNTGALNRYLLKQSGTNAWKFKSTNPWA